MRSINKVCDEKHGMMALRKGTISGNVKPVFYVKSNNDFSTYFRIYSSCRTYLVQQLGRLNRVPKSIVAGIATVGRRRDLTISTTIKEEK